MPTTDKQYVDMLCKEASYDYEAKKNFHRAAKTLLKRLAERLDKTGGPGTDTGYGVRDPIRSNQGGIAVSGEVTLHYDRLYVQVSQRFASSAGVMFRECKSRKDYSGGYNNFATFAMLCNTEDMARLIESRCTFKMLVGGEVI
jgi:hypothetical protein